MKQFGPWATAALLLLAACQPDRCADLVCQHGGECQPDGRCFCPEGYTGLYCEVVLDPCARKACATPGTDTCIGNATTGTATCVCKPGWEGETCSQTWEQKYIGAYAVSETCNGTTLGFVAEVKLGPKANSLEITNFHNQHNPPNTSRVVAELASATAIEVYEQAMYYGFVKGYGGTGGSSAQFTLTYTVISLDKADTLRCAATFLRQ